MAWPGRIRICPCLQLARIQRRTRRHVQAVAEWNKQEGTLQPRLATKPQQCHKLTNVAYAWGRHNVPFVWCGRLRSPRLAQHRSIVGCRPPRCRENRNVTLWQHRAPVPPPSALRGWLRVGCSLPYITVRTVEGQQYRMLNHRRNVHLPHFQHRQPPERSPLGFGRSRAHTVFATLHTGRSSTVNRRFGTPPGFVNVVW